MSRLPGHSQSVTQTWPPLRACWKLRHAWRGSILRSLKHAQDGRSRDAGIRSLGERRTGPTRSVCTFGPRTKKVSSVAKVRNVCCGAEFRICAPLGKRVGIFEDGWQRPVLSLGPGGLAHADPFRDARSIRLHSSGWTRRRLGGSPARLARLCRHPRHHPRLPGGPARVARPDDRRTVPAIRGPSGLRDRSRAYCRRHDLLRGPMPGAVRTRRHALCRWSRSRLGRQQCPVRDLLLCSRASRERIGRQGLGRRSRPCQ